MIKNKIKYTYDAEGEPTAEIVEQDVHPDVENYCPMDCKGGRPECPQCKPDEPVYEGDPKSLGGDGFAMVFMDPYH